jgi:hypothetical protein
METSAHIGKIVLEVSPHNPRGEVETL